MRIFWVVLTFLMGGLSSCDKAKQAADAVRAKLDGAADPGAPAEPGGAVAPDLASQVDSAAEGVRFRRDLPFPAAIKIRVTERSTFKNVRIMSFSELGKETGSLTGTWEEVGLIDRQGSRVTLTVEKTGMVMETGKGTDKDPAAAPAKESPLPVPAMVVGKPLEFELGPKGWRAFASNGAVDFQSKIRSDELIPVLADTLADHGGLPRTQWFSSSRRWIGGDKMVLEGPAVNLLFPGKHSKGKLTLVYEAPEALEGHPCGRFAVSGDATLEGEVGLDGQVISTDTTINSGKIWCSLIFPLVLREEFDAVSTIVKGQGGGPGLRIQGGVVTVTTRQWKP